METTTMGFIGIIGDILGLYRDYGKENGNYIIISGYILGLYSRHCMHRISNFLDQLETTPLNLVQTPAKSHMAYARTPCALNQPYERGTWVGHDGGSDKNLRLGRKPQQARTSDKNI